MRIQSLDRAISILNLFRNSRNPIGISEMAAALDLAKTTVHGLVSTLEKNGFLIKDAGTRKYRLGFALYELGSNQMSHLEINQRSASPLQHLANQLDRICRVAIWDRDSIMITMNLMPQGHESTTRQFGPRMPAYCTGLGKAILASMTAAALTAYLDRTELIAYTPNTIVDRDLLEKDLQEVKARGYAISNQEALLHQAGIGAPVLTSGGEVAGAVSTRLESVELGSAFMRTAADLLMRAANRISLEMGYQPMDMAHRSIQ